ncbi:udp-n-acetylglucosamine diphosphorylase [Chrysochromulina tobinii]|uniref:UDP-N-acetylglucosamine diphosphorylase n=1 Tax=Chrysochromulina tobinii TaxID=1460289 RepID=A0A0M0J2R6_9EUKA|nr:udp-n-acetylglucosamine diphosphorylase [Chrysochromulina tobinii]|eukprot:KOO20820.1 udp-n-acetylglucosamine diphosphorylase [Chrysochromulina sp. CCMP291]
MLPNARMQSKTLFFSLVRRMIATLINRVAEKASAHSGSVLSVAFSPDGTKIVSGSEDGTFKVWDSDALGLLSEKPNAHSFNIPSVAFSPDGTKIVSGSGDQTIKVWDSDKLELLSEKTNAHSGTVYSVAFSPDGTKIVSGSWDKTIKVWDMVKWSRKDHLMFNATTQRFVVQLLWLNKYSMKFPDDVLDLLIEACLQSRWLRAMVTNAGGGSTSAEAANTPEVWRDMERRLERAGQLHVGLPKLLATSLENAQTVADKQVEPFKAERLADLPEAEAVALRERGLSMIARSEVAALLLAGGQGTRLGIKIPKGCYDIGLPSGKSLFQYHAERIRKVKQLAAAHAGKREADVRLPFLIMTSDATDSDTRAFFRQHAFFGLPEDQVHFFAQGALPCLTPEGKLILDAPGLLAMAPNGNGGCYVSLRDSGLLEQQLDASGVTSIFQFGVDNVLCHVADPTFVGFCSARHADCASKTVPKRDAHEPVGVVALAGGRPAVVEYSEISREMAEAKDAHGRLLFGDAHICVNFFSVPFLKSFCARLGPFGIQLPLHVAHKKIPYTDASGTRRTPTSNNGIKLELFIFDTFPFAKQMAALQVARDEEFAPVKNEPGAKSDSPDTARALVSALSKRRILAAGGAIRGDAIVELSPMASYQGEGLADRVAGRTFSTPVHLE